MRIFIVLFFSLNFLASQKLVKKTIIDDTISFFQVDSSNCFIIDIQTTDTDEIVVEATIDGEYKKDLVLNVEEEGKSVTVSADFQPNFKNPNDKLSAHKVVSIALVIKLPANKNVQVFGTSSTIQTSGLYKKLRITLNDGTVQLNDVKGFVDITTQSGDIIVESAMAEILSTSKYGKVDENLIPTGNTKYQLNTVTGNIRLKRIE